MTTPIRNPKLYTILREDCHEIEIAGIGEPGTYTYPAQKNCGLRKSSKRKGVGRVMEWGETYHINCPRCGDTKRRLYVSHYTGANAFTSKKRDKTTNKMVPCSAIEFGIVAVCHNEHCNIAPYLRDVVRKAGRLGDVIVHAPMAFNGGIMTSVPLPNNYSLFDSAVPDSVLEYIGARRYSADYLQKAYDIRYMPPGTRLWDRPDGSEVVSWDERLLIPVYRSKRVIGWQARIAEEVVKVPGVTSKVKKYLFPPVAVTGGQGKGSWFYNSYAASYCFDIVLVEGVTDVWRVGPHAMCIFGKTLTEAQLGILQDVWGFFASCVIVFDGDPEAWDAACKLRDRLREKGVFKRGVTALRLAEGYDPDDYSTEEINVLIDEARAQCK